MACKLQFIIIIFLLGRTLLRGEFQPPKIFPNQTYGAWRPHVGLCPKFRVMVNFAVVLHYIER